MARFKEFEFKDVFWEQNKEANDLTQIASGYKLSKQNFKALIIVKEKLQEEVEILNIDVMRIHNWRKLLLEYLWNPKLSVNRKQNINLPITSYLKMSCIKRVWKESC